MQSDSSASLFFWFKWTFLGNQPVVPMGIIQLGSGTCVISNMLISVHGHTLVDYLLSNEQFGVIRLPVTA